MAREALTGVDEAVRAFLAGKYPGELCTGWVLMYSVADYTDGEVAYLTSYAVGPETDLARSVGMAVLGQRRMLADIESNAEDDS